MSENTWEVNWTQVGQLRIEIESDIRSKICNEISTYSALASERGISTYFISGLDVAANIALFGPPQKENKQEDKENE